MKRGHHLKFTQYFKILTLYSGEGGIFGKSRCNVWLEFVSSAP